MLIAIAIAEEIQGLQRIALKFWASEFSLTLARSLSCTGLSWSWARTPQRFTPAQTSTTQTFCQSQRKLRISKLCNSWISSAMAMAMSIYRTLCVDKALVPASDAGTSATTPWERLQNLWWAIAQRKLAATQVSRLIIPPTYVEIHLDSLCQIWGKSQSA